MKDWLEHPKVMFGIASIGAGGGIAGALGWINLALATLAVLPAGLLGARSLWRISRNFKAWWNEPEEKK
jgi:hypothetical protein